MSKAHSLVERKLGESSLLRRMSLHLLTVSKSRKVSPTLNRVAKQRATSLRVGGPGDSCILCVNCSTSFFWHPLMSFCNNNNTHGSVSVSFHRAVLDMIRLLYIKVLKYYRVAYWWEAYLFQTKTFGWIPHARNCREVIISYFNAFGLHFKELSIFQYFVQ